MAPQLAQAGAPDTAEGVPVRRAAFSARGVGADGVGRPRELCGGGEGERVAGGEGERESVNIGDDMRRCLIAALSRSTSLIRSLLGEGERILIGSGDGERYLIGLGERGRGLGMNSYSIAADSLLRSRSNTGRMVERSAETVKPRRANGNGVNRIVFLAGL